MALWRKYMKWIAVIMILLGTSGYGYSVMEEDKRIVRLLETQERMLGLLKGEIQHFHRNLADAFQRVGVKLEEPYGVFLQRVSERMKQWKGEVLQIIWLEELKNIEREYDISAKLHNELSRFVENIDYDEYTMQIEAFEHVRYAIAKQIECKREKVNQNQKWVMWFCTLLGILCVIVLI